MSRYGPAGCRNSSAGLRRNTPRSRMCSSSVTVAPLLTGALGMRKAVARSLMSATVRSAIHSRSCGAYRWVSSPMRTGAAGSIHSGWPTMAHRSNHCCAVPHPRATSPSLAAATPGWNSERPVRQGRRSVSKKVTG